MTLVYRSTVGRRLTVSEGDGNISELSSSAGISFLQSGSVTTRTVQEKLRDFISVKDFGINGDDTDESAKWVTLVTAMGSGGQTIYIPKGSYNVGSTGIDFSALTEGFRLIGDGHSTDDGTYIYGAVASGDVLKFVPGGSDRPFTIENISFNNTSGTGQSAIHVEDILTGKIVSCRIRSAGTYGIFLPANTFTLLLQDLRVQGVGNTGIGISAHNHTHIVECDVVGWNEGARLSGQGCLVTGGRWEVNVIGLRTGLDYTGAGAVNRGLTVSGMTFEANDTAMLIGTAQGCKFHSIFIQGTVGAPSGQSQYGIRVSVGGGTFTDTSFDSISIGGNGGFDTASIDVNATAAARVSWSNVDAGNAHATGAKWAFTSACNTLMSFLNVSNLTVVGGGAIAVGAITANGHLTFVDNTYDIGANAATRPRTAYIATSVDVGGAARLISAGIVNTAASGSLSLTGGTASNGGNIICFGGSEATTPSEIRMRQGTTLRWKVATGTGHFVGTTATSAFGYAAGAGGTVTQGSGSGKATGVTLSTVTGEITMDGATLNADTTVSFTLTNTVIAAGDHILVQHVSGGTVGSYMCTAVAASGSATVYVRNITAGNLTEAPVLKFSVVKAATA